MSSITLFSGGAAHGIVKALTPAFTAATGLAIDGTFSAVGGLKARLLAGEKPDMVILTAAIIGELEDKDLAVAKGSRVVGAVTTAVAMRNDDPAPDLRTADDLRVLLLRASAIHYPDPEQATAGIHFASVLRRLGIFDQTAAHHRTFPNGATAMAALAASKENFPVGCTQQTEIVSTPGIRAISDLPGDLGLCTIYTAALMKGSAHAQAVRWLIKAMAAPDHAALRTRCGFA
jgi:molybdate transport system substrate-binding protein